MVLGSHKSEEVKTSLVYLTPWGEERTGALLGRSPKVREELGHDHGLLYLKVPAGFQARSLAQKAGRMTFHATSLRTEI